MKQYEKVRNTIHLEDETRTMFGICVDGINFPDITADEAVIDSLVETCNRLALDPDLLEEIVEDFMDKHYTYEIYCRPLK